MSTPAGWYDDGSGRQRWWDGTQWTDNYAPGQAAASASAQAADPSVQSGSAQPGAQSPAAGYPQQAAPAPSGPRLTPTLGYIGLGLAVLGTILACIPMAITFVIGLLVLLAGFVVSLIAVFKKNTIKWPSITGIVLSIVGGVIGVTVFIIVSVVNVVSAVSNEFPSGFPTSITSEQPSAPSAPGDSEGRPSAEEIGQAYLAELQSAGVTDYDDEPAFIDCMGQQLHDSDLSDEAMRDLVNGQEIPADEQPLALKVTSEGVVTCATR